MLLGPSTVVTFTTCPSGVALAVTVGAARPAVLTVPVPVIDLVPDGSLSGRKDHEYPLWQHLPDLGGECCIALKAQLREAHAAVPGR